MMTLPYHLESVSASKAAMSKVAERVNKLVTEDVLLAACKGVLETHVGSSITVNGDVLGSLFI
jgi:hypothetical protein